MRVEEGEVTVGGYGNALPRWSQARLYRGGGKGRMRRRADRFEITIAREDRRDGIDAIVQRAILTRLHQPKVARGDRQRRIATDHATQRQEIGRASCRERVCQYV